MYFFLAFNFNFFALWQCYLLLTAYTVCIMLYIIMLMRDEEGRKKEANKVKQTTKQSNTHVHVYTCWKSDCLGCVVLLCLVVCMTLFASFFLMHLSLTCIIYNVNYYSSIQVFH